eukprot:CAMPEP_0117479082 /NCGR_PEP_ID=MMETSP0784-20121206/11698_1 /TAXON_ID=39447 /ORGANISM="" /LENGTH=454 /DNA_ID=CAMNT_0005273491 /DNA_START=177 /DNA_END=1544 /DNA_ORIENTATION=-
MVEAIDFAMQFQLLHPWFCIILELNTRLVHGIFRNILWQQSAFFLQSTEVLEGKKVDLREHTGAANATRRGPAFEVSVEISSSTCSAAALTVFTHIQWAWLNFGPFTHTVWAVLGVEHVVCAAAGAEAIAPGPGTCPSKPWDPVKWLKKNVPWRVGILCTHGLSMAWASSGPGGLQFIFLPSSFQCFSEGTCSAKPLVLGCSHIGQAYSHRPDTLSNTSAARAASGSMNLRQPPLSLDMKPLSYARSTTGATGGGGAAQCEAIAAVLASGYGPGAPAGVYNVEHLLAGMAPEHLPAGTALEHWLAGTAPEHVLPGKALEHWLAGMAPEHLLACTRLEHLQTCMALEHLQTGVALEHLLAGTALEHLPAGNRVHRRGSIFLCRRDPPSFIQKAMPPSHMVEEVEAFGRRNALHPRSVQVLRDLWRRELPVELGPESFVVCSADQVRLHTLGARTA